MPKKPETKQKNETDKSSSKIPKNNGMGLWLLIFGSMLLFMVFNNQQQTPGVDINYSQFKEQLKQNNIETAVIKGTKVEATLREKRSIGEKKDVTKVKTLLPNFTNMDIVNILEEKGVDIDVKSEETPWFMALLINLLPWVLIIGFFVYSSRKMRQGLSGMGKDSPFSFAKSKAKKFEKKESSLTFNDVAGSENAKKELSEVVDFLKTPEKFKDIGAKLPKGVLMVGPPGTGKTLMAKAVAGEAEVPFFSISGSEFIEMFVGVGASRVRDLFEDAKKNAPAIIFIDEIDSIGRSRGTGVGGGHDEREQTLNQILAEMDGFEDSLPVVVIAATNRPDVLDPALVRPGRFDRHVTLDLPQKSARQKIIELHLSKVKADDNVDTKKIAGGTIGFSGAQLRNLVNEAAIVAARRESKTVTMDDFHDAREKILMGAKRDEKLEDKQRKVVAIHECGHALAAYFLENADPLQKVSIIARGRALGVTEQLPDEDQYNISRSYLLDRIGVMLGGRIAEKVVVGDITTGAEDDLKRATQLARKMVMNWGMSEKIGYVSFRQGEEHQFLGKEMMQDKDFSEATAQEVDLEVRSIINDMKQKITSLIENKQAELEKLADLLMEKESLEIEQIKEVLGPN